MSDPGLEITLAPGISLTLKSAAALERAFVAMQLLKGPVEQFHRMLDAPPLRLYAQEVVQRYLRERTPCAKHAGQTQSRMDTLVGILTSVDPQRSIASLCESDLALIRREIPKLIARQGTTQGSTLERYYRLFNWLAREAARDGHLANPPHAECHYRRPAGEATQPFTATDLQALFNGPLYQPWADTPRSRTAWEAHPFKFWIVPLGLFCGMRLNEICQLCLRDIRIEEGMLVISITDDGQLQSLKNPHSRRRLPVPQTVLAMGFEEFIAERRTNARDTDQVFPELTYSEQHLFSRQATRFFLGYDRVEGYMPSTTQLPVKQGWNVKSLRRTFAQTLRDQGAPIEVIADLLGHAPPPHLTIARQHYAGQTLLEARREALDMFALFDIDTSHVHWRHYRALRQHNGNRQRRGAATRR